MAEANGLVGSLGRPPVVAAAAGAATMGSEFKPIGTGPSYFRVERVQQASHKPMARKFPLALAP